MSQENKRVLGYIAVVVGLLVGLGCSVDSPTTPVQGQQPPSGSSPASETFNIDVVAVPDSIAPGGTSRIEVSVRDASGNWPANGTLVDLHVNRGNFINDASLLTKDVLVELTRGESSALFAALNSDNLALGGRFRVTATLASSSAVETINADGGPVTAAFATTVAGLTVGFTNNSTGVIDSFSWDFGDGSTSREFEPIHHYAEAGEYLVVLTVSGPGGSDTALAALVVGAEEPASP